MVKEEILDSSASISSTLCAREIAKFFSTSSAESPAPSLFCEGLASPFELSHALFIEASLDKG